MSRAVCVKSNENTRSSTFHFRLDRTIAVFSFFSLFIYIYRFQSILRTIIGAGLMETQRIVESNRDGGSTRSGLLICHDDVL